MDYQLKNVPMVLNGCLDIDQPLFEVDEDALLCQVRALEAPDFACKLIKFEDGQVEITAYPIPLKTSQEIRMGNFDPYATSTVSVQCGAAGRLRTFEQAPPTYFFRKPPQSAMAEIPTHKINEPQDHYHLRLI